MRARLEAAFEEFFGCSPERIARAPGRVNLIGDHTDYNDGWVLPMAIDFHIWTAIAARSDPLVRVQALDMGEGDVFEVGAPTFLPAGGWKNYVRGVVASLLPHHSLSNGFDLVISGDVPLGAGLSSSAALEISVITAIESAAGLVMSPLTRALIGQAAENNFVGCQCGIMDQLISSTAQAGHASLIDCRSLEATPVALPEGVSVLVVDSAVPRALVDSAYNLRRQECSEAATVLGAKSLRDVAIEQVKEAEGWLDQTLLKRARHVVTENLRTRAMLVAVRGGDLESIGGLMGNSHASLRDDFEVSIGPVDQLVGIIESALGGLGGARMTGGGFGGAVVALLPEDRLVEVERRVEGDYPKLTGLTPRSLRCVPAAGAGLI